MVAGDKPMDILLEAEARIKAANHHPNSIAVLIVQIGNDPYAAKYFKELSQVVVCPTLPVFHRFAPKS